MEHGYKDTHLERVNETVDIAVRLRGDHGKLVRANTRAESVETPLHLPPLILTADRSLAYPTSLVGASPHPLLPSGSISRGLVPDVSAPDRAVGGCRLVPES